MNLEYENTCYECGFVWQSEADDDPCPVCDEMENIGTDYIE